MPTCECNLVALLQISYDGIVSASLNGSTTVEIAEDGLVLLGATVNNLNITAYPFEPGGDWFLGATCASTAQAQINWLQKYDCFNDKMHFIPKTGGKASITGGPIEGVYLSCDPNIVSESFSASAQQGPASPYVTTERRDGYGLVYTGGPIPINSSYPTPYSIVLGELGTFSVYLQSFNLSINPPGPSSVSYGFVF